MVSRIDAGNLPRRRKTGEAVRFAADVDVDRVQTAALLTDQRRHGIDALSCALQVGRTAAVMLGSTETTFYAIGVYFGAAGVRRTRYTLPAALLADLTGFWMAAASVRLFSALGLYI